MVKNNEIIKELYLKYLNHTATSDEFDQLFEYLKNPENLEILNQEMSREWHSSDDHKNFSPVYWEEIEMQILKRNALARKKALERQDRKYWWTAAASILLVVGLSIGIYLTSGTDGYTTYTTGYGQVEKILLDDGSQVTLNANSVLKWRNNWKNEGKRIAVLDGEAYFDIESILDQKTNKKKGFDVQTNDLTIQVVGTSFNVKSRTEKTDVYLDEGKIHLDLNESIRGSTEEKGKDEIVMNPGESVSYSFKTKKLARAENDQYGNASWMAGTFMYTNQSVKDILQSLEEIYGVEFQIHDENLLNRKLTTNLPYSDWPIVESALELLLHARIEKSDNTITIIN